MLTDVQLTGLVLLPVALLGTVCNWTAFLVIQKLPGFRNAFGYLSTSQALADAFHSTCFLIYFCPMVIGDNALLKTYSKHCGFVLLFSYELSVQIHLVISLNRFFAAWTPFKYKSMFRLKITKFIIGLVWTFTFITTFTFYEVLCDFYFDEQTGFFNFTNSHLCGVISWYADFCKYLTIVICIVIIDISTIHKVRSTSNKVRNNITMHAMHRISTREINFLKQTVFQGFVFALELVTYFMLPPVLTDEWAIFFATSFAWVTVHAVDGIIMICFNPEFKKYLLHCESNFQFSGSHDARTHTISTNY